MAFELDQNKELPGIEQDDKLSDIDGHREHLMQLEKLSQKLEEYFAIRRF